MSWKFRCDGVPSALVLGLGGAAALIGCAGGDPGGAEARLGSTSQAVFGGGPDVGEPADAVVAIAARPSAASAACGGPFALPEARCNGVLVSPTLVLTTKECANLFGSGADLAAYVGRDAATMRCQYPIRGVLASQTGNVGVRIDGAHLALLELLEPALAGEVSPVRPTLESFEALAAPVGTDSLRFSVEGARLVGWSAYDGEGQRSPELAKGRQSAELAVSAVARVSGTDGNVLFTNAYDQGDAPMRGLGQDDFGAALFLRSRTSRAWVLAGLGASPKASAPFREAIAPAQAGCNTLSAPGYPAYNVCDAWVDLLATSTRDWLRGAARDSYGDNKPTWARMHASTSGNAERWRGDVDYVGPCAVATDGDCDHWFTKDASAGERDNCPNMPNPDQADADDDGVGDRCESTAANFDHIAAPWFGNNRDGFESQVTIRMELVNGQRIMRVRGFMNELWYNFGGPVEVGSRTLTISFAAEHTNKGGTLYWKDLDGKPIPYEVEHDASGRPTRLWLKDWRFGTSRFRLPR